MPWEKSFSTDEALAAATDVFHEHGYAATSMAMLLERMGIQKGSFYATFGSKREVFLAALRQYIAMAGRSIADERDGRQAREVLVDLMQTSASECQGRAASRGCMLVNTAIELGPHDPEVQSLVRQALDAQSDALRQILQEAQAEGDIAADLDPEAIAQMLLSVRLGLRVMGRSGQGVPAARAAVERALSLLEPG